jgi:hypothetical protein
MAGYTLWGKKISSDIRKQLGIFNIEVKLTQYKINWREHIQSNAQENFKSQTSREKKFRKPTNEMGR